MEREEVTCVFDCSMRETWRVSAVLKGKVQMRIKVVLCFETDSCRRHYLMSCELPVMPARERLPTNRFS